MKLCLTVVGLSLAFLGSCADSHKSNEGAKLASEGVFDPAPAPSERNSVKSRLKRYRTQTRFLNPLPYSRITKRTMSEASDRTRGGGGTAKRAVQEADVFKVGDKGSRLLYLLNNYRGLQVVSFAKGPARPELVGRVEATGNRPDTMYYDEKRKRLVVIERLWIDDQGNRSNWRKQTSRIVVYNVANPKKPAIAQKVVFEGDVADNRLVGDVLYVAASYTPRSEQHKRWHERRPQGVVYSYQLGDEVKLIDSAKLALPAQRNNMNIVETAVKGASDKFNYYLVAAINKSTWWPREGGAIEVIDITNPKGKILPLMVAPSKGVVRERSSTHIKNKTLIVTSNYRSKVGQRLQRVAVETFVFPTKDSEVLSADELQYRKLHIEREVAKVSGESAKAQLRAKLLKDKTLGLAGRFHKTPSGNLQKVMADSTVTVGDSRGQHARLQDVRYAGNKLYAFWVPANRIDPLDVFDISAPEKGVKHVGHLEFEGWIQRSFPVSYQGKDYILGLGRIVPSVNNERGWSYPQARLIQIKTRRNGTVKAVDVDDITFKDKGIWTNFNAQDKFVELNFSSASKGTILFRATSYSQNKYLTGGKLVGIDLSKADQAEVFTEGGFLKSDWGWLRRVFTNKEINRVNTFSDEQLQVFGVVGAGTASKIYNAVSSLELARNIRAYLSVTPSHGLQIISKGHDSYWWSRNNSNARTVLRLVNAAKADAEVSQILKSTIVAGAYLAHYQAKGRMFLLTQQTTWKKVKDSRGREYRQPERKLLLTYLKAGPLLKVVDQTSWKADLNSRRPFFGGLRWRPQPLSVPKFVRLADGNLYLSHHKQIRLVDVKPAPRNSVKLVSDKVKLEDCKLKTAHNVQIHLQQSGPYLTWYHVVDKDGKRVDNTPAPRNEKQYAENYFAILKKKAKAAFACEGAVNTPGAVVSYAGKNRHGLKLITDDLRLVGQLKTVYKRGDKEIVYYNDQTERNLVSLRGLGSRAMILSMYDGSKIFGRVGYYSSIWSQLRRIDDTTFMFMDKASAYNKIATFYTVSLDSVGRFTQHKQYMNLKVGSYPALSALIKTTKGHLGIVRSGRQVQVIRWKSLDTDPVELKVAKIDSVSGKTLKRSEFAVVPGYYYSYYGAASSALDFDKRRGILSIPAGMHGVAQVKIFQ